MDNHRFLIAFKLSLVTVFFPLMLLDLLLPYGFLWVVFVLWIVSTIILYVYLPPKKELNLRERIKNPRYIAVFAGIALVLILCLVLLPTDILLQILLILLFLGFISRLVLVWRQAKREKDITAKDD